MVMSQSDSPADAPLCYLFMIIAGVTHSPEELEPTCRLLSRRFTGEIWSFGSNDADVVFDRMRLRVVKDRSRSSLLNFANFAHRVLTHARVPPNDGGISLGQAAVAGARDRRDGR